MIAAAFSILQAPLLFACATLVPADGSGLPAGCPTYTVVHGGSNACGKLNIVFLPAGFTEDELGTYRCAVRLLVDQLLTAPPYSSYAAVMNVYRLDVASTTSGVPVDGACVAHCLENDLGGTWPNQRWDCLPRATLAGTPPGSVEAVWSTNANPPSCIQADLDLELCGYDPKVCRLLWPGNQALAQRLGSCAPGHDVTVLVANSAAHAGGGSESPSIVVVTLEGIADGSARANLLAHELGHSTGLLDEYDSTGVILHYSPGRNVAWEGDANFPDSVPWSQSCDGSCGGSAAGWSTPSCTRPPRPVSPVCTVISNSSTACCSQPCAQPDCQPPGTEIGLWEGAIATKCGYFRSAKDCRMGADLGQGFCEACLDYVDRQWAHLGPCLPERIRHNFVFNPFIRIVAPQHERETIVSVPPEARALGVPTSIDPEVMSQIVEGGVVAFRAVVEINGIKGELDIEALRMSVVDPATPGQVHTVSIQRSRSMPFDHLSWSVDGVPLRKDASGDAARRLLAAAKRFSAGGAVTVVAGAHTLTPASVILRTVRRDQP